MSKTGVAVWGACALLICGMLGSNMVKAQGNVPDVLFEKALKTFQAEDYERALEQFLRARDAGFDRPALDYNLGVTYYKLGRYADAERTFLKAASRQPNLQPLIHYNLGLVTLKQNKIDEAVSWFHATLDETQDAKLRRLATEMLSRLDEAKAVILEEQAEAEDGKEEVRLQWQGVAIAGFGFDDNVTLRSEQDLVTASGRKDNFHDLFLTASTHLRESPQGDVVFEGGAYLLRYGHLTNYNQDDVRLALRYARVYGDWFSSLGAQINQTYLDGDEFQRMYAVNADAKHVFENGARLRLYYEYDHIKDIDPAYDYLAGWSQTAEAGMIWPRNGGRYSLGYVLELNNRGDVQSPLFTSYSPTRQTAYATGVWALGGNVDGKLDVRYRHSRYNDPNVLADGSTMVRLEDRYRVTAGVSKMLNRWWELNAEISYADNDSNMPAYRYHRQQYLLSVVGSF